MKRLVTCAILIGAAVHPIFGTVLGRYLRIEAPVSANIGLYEVEIISGGKNIALYNENIEFSGFGYKGGDINDRDRGKALINNTADFGARSTVFSTAGELNVWIEMDLGTERPIDSVVIKSAQKPVYRDRGLRLVSVLNSQRKILWAETYNTNKKPYSDGTTTLNPVSGKGAFIGRVVPPGSDAWVQLSELLEVSAATSGLTKQEQIHRAESFSKRNTPEKLEELAHAFFARMDLEKPELSRVQTFLEAREFEKALNAYRDHFLTKIQTIGILDEEGRPLELTPPRYPVIAEDLIQGIAVTIGKKEAIAQTFSPGVIDWETTNRQVGHLQNPLLYAYSRSGNPAYLRQWVTLTDDWGMNLLPTLTQAAAEGRDLRDYFVKTPLQEFNRFIANLAITASEQQELASLLPGSTLARLLIPVLEEYPPAYWWVCRRASFNHTYNALIAASITSRILDDFHAGQRLDNENRQHWQRVWTANMTRDGSMNEIGDEGHLFMQWRMAAYVDQMKRTPPPWLTPDFLAEFETGWKNTATYPVKRLAPDGFGHRLGSRDVDYFEKLWWLIDPTQGIRELGESDTLDNTEIVQDPDFAGIIQAVFGRGQDRETLSTRRQDYYDLVTGYYGENTPPPTMVSNFMPYAGIWNLRRSWKPDATYVEMMGQPPGHPSVNGSTWNTWFYLFDYGHPLLSYSPVWIDGQPPLDTPEGLTYKPGSKTERLATASPKPLPSRWHSSALLDYAESFNKGTYQTHSRGKKDGTPTLLLGDSPIYNVRADRKVILFRPARLMIVTDAVRTPDPSIERSYQIRQRFATPNGENPKNPIPEKFLGDARALRLLNKGAPGITLRRFTTAELSWDQRETPDSWKKGASMMNYAGVNENLGGMLRAKTQGNLLMSALIETHPFPGENEVMSTHDLSTDKVTGFKADLTNGATLVWLSTGGESALHRIGALELQGEAILLYHFEEMLSGIILGGESLRIRGERMELSASDFEFRLSSSTDPSTPRFSLSTTPIYRPIQPVTFSPEVNVFTDSQTVTLNSATPKVEIRYTLDGSEPDLSSLLYTEPLILREDTYLRARAFRPGGTDIPFSTAGTHVTAISDARYIRRTPKPARAVSTSLAPGLSWELVEANWFNLFSYLHIPNILPADASGVTSALLDVSMRKNDGPFGIRYRGFIEIPSTGVWTFHAPTGYVGADFEPGYDLRIWIDGEEWDLGQRFHGRGLWSVPLEKGLHSVQITFADARNLDRTVPNSGLWRGYPSPWVVWKGEAPIIELSGPQFEKQPLPSQWLKTSL